MAKKLSLKKRPMQNEAGFTLLEIIAVMVIMSILAVVAVPKYFDLQTQAKTRAMDTAMAEAVGRVNGYFAQRVLAGATPNSNDPVNGIVYSDANLGTDLGDFTLAVVDNGPSASEPDCTNTTTTGCIDLTVTAVAGTAVAGATPVTRSIPRPGGP